MHQVDRLPTDIGLPKLSAVEISELLRQLESVAKDYLPRCPSLQPYLLEIQKFCEQLDTEPASISGMWSYRPGFAVDAAIFAWVRLCHQLICG